MSYFIPSFLQKRILRYAISRLELLDTDALDLEDLDIAWGKRSTVELRDVGIRVKKISSLLQLPKYLSVSRAKVGVLRLTVPSNIHQSGILVEADGVEIKVELSFDKSGVHQKPKKEYEKAEHGAGLRAYNEGRSRSTQYHVHDPGGTGSNVPGLEESASDDDSPDHLPSTTDLAQSFLQSEPKEEKEELQAALLQSQYMEQSQTSEQGADAGNDTGIGSDLSLPAFLADFLKGVVDRVQIQIRNVKIDLEMQLDIPSSSNMGSEPVPKTESVTFRIIVEEIMFGSALAAVATETDLGRIASATQELRGQRRVCLNRIHFMMVSDASLFSQVARSPIPSSPGTTHASTIMTARSHPSMSPERRGSHSAASRSSSQGEGDSQSATDHISPEFCIRKESTGSLGSQRQNTPPGEFMNSDESDHDRCSVNASTTSIDTDHVYEGLPNRPANVGLFEYTCSNTCQPPDLPASPESSFHNLQREQECSPQHATFDVLPSPVRQQKDRVISDAGSGRPTRISRSDSPPVEDLTESRLFSHEEATSMYMSAISQISPALKPTKGALPGDWRSTLSDEGDSQSPPQNPLAQDSNVLGPPTGSQQKFLKESMPSIDLIDPSLQDVERSQTPRPPSSHITASAGSAGDVKLDDIAAKTSSPQGNTSSQDLDSLVDVDNSILLVKTIITIDSVVFTISTEMSKSKEIPNMNSDSRSQGAVPDDAVKSELRSHETNQAIQAIAVEINKIHIVGDMTLTKMAILAIQQTTSSLQEPCLTKKNSKPQASSRQPLSLNIMLQSVSWRFLDAVKGNALIGGSFATANGNVDSIADDSDVLLRADIARFRLSYMEQHLSSTTKVTVGKFHFGYAATNIVSFEPSLKMRDSTRDILAPVDGDMMLTMKKSKSTLGIDVTTHPIRVVLDLRRLDETFSWFGGLSSMLGLGSSMLSTVTLKDVHRYSTPAKSKRGVHFEPVGAAFPPAEDLNSMQYKVTARIGGLALDLQGHQATVRLKSTAMKLVRRTEGLGLQIDRLKLKGPYIDSTDSDASLLVKLSNIRAEYLSTPKEVDLARLIELVFPSQLKDEDKFKDGLLVDTMLRQRRQGGVLRLTIDKFEGSVLKLKEFETISSLVDDLKKLSTVAKYLPEDDRPGILILTLLKTIQMDIRIGDRFGTTHFLSKNVEVAHVTFPTLAALGIQGLDLYRNEDEDLIGTSFPLKSELDSQLPLLLARFIGNEMEPTIRIRVHDLRLEYHVSMLMSLMSQMEDASAEEVLCDIVNSVATLTGREYVERGQRKPSNTENAKGTKSGTGFFTPGIDMVMKDTIIGLNPRGSLSKSYIIMEEAYVTSLTSSCGAGKQTQTLLEIKKLSAMLIEDKSKSTMTGDSSRSRGYIDYLTSVGFVPVGTLMALKMDLQTFGDGAANNDLIKAEVDGGLLLLETCADSTQTLQEIISGLSPPMPKTTQLKYRTEAVPIQDMLASFSGDAYVSSEYSHLDDEQLPLGLEEGDLVDDEVPQNLEFVSSFYNPDPAETSRMVTDSMLEEDLESMVSPSAIREIGDKNLLESFEEQAQIAPGNAPLEFRENHFAIAHSTEGTPQRHNNMQNIEQIHDASLNPKYPLRLKIRDIHIIWNLFDGYDWQHTRDKISQAVAEVQSKANERLARKDKRKSLDPQERDEDVIGDFLFNSIYIGIPANGDPTELARQVNRNIDDLASETGSHTSSTPSESPSRQGLAPRTNGRRLRLQRSKYHKMTFELKGVSVDLTIHPPDSGETQSSIDIRVQDLEIFDHVPTSTWKKFATYMHDAGERESETSMVRLEIRTVKPVPDLAASEIILKVNYHSFI